MDELYLSIVGHGGVGKTSLSLRFVKDDFTESYVPTIEDEFIKNVIIDGESHETYIIDTAGQDEFKDLKSSSIRKCDGFILVYAVNDLKSVEALKENFDLIKSCQKNTENIIILGNKCDLPEDEWENRKEDVKMRIKSWAENIPIYEVSAKTGIGVNESFEKLCRIILGKGAQGEGEGGCCNIQ